MKFTIITHVNHIRKEDEIYAYEPYVKEMNLWLKHVESVVLVATVINRQISPIDISYSKTDIDFREVQSFSFINWKGRLRSLFVIPKIFYTIFKACKQADHIHLRCPGNVGLLGCLVQVLFPRKQKTVKYAGNWDFNSKQPLSYKFQKWILSNTFLTKNTKVLVYGKWKNQSKNIVPFFTASFSKKEVFPVKIRKLEREIKFLYAGSFTKNKRPLFTLEVVHELFKQGFEVVLNMYGDGEEMGVVKKYIVDNSLEKIVKIHGNQPKQILKEAYKESHFLVFISKSEGWPKVVAESMFYGCLPISSRVSCVPFMLDYGERGILVDEVDKYKVVDKIKNHANNPILYKEKVVKAIAWSQKYTLEYFDDNIKKILINK